MLKNNFRVVTDRGGGNLKKFKLKEQSSWNLLCISKCGGGGCCLFRKKSNDEGFIVQDMMAKYEEIMAQEADYSNVLKSLRMLDALINQINLLNSDQKALLLKS